MTHVTTERLIDYIHGVLAPEDDAAVYAHVTTCTACRAEYRAELTLSETLKAQAAAEELEFPSIVKAKVWQAIRAAERPSLAQRLHALLRPALAVPLAAALVLAALAGIRLSPGSAPQISVAYFLEEHAAQQVQTPLADRAAGSTAQLEESAALAADSSDQETTATSSALAGAEDGAQLR